MVKTADTLTQPEKTLANHLRELRAILKTAKGETKKRLKARVAECEQALAAERGKHE